VKGGRGSLTSHGKAFVAGRQLRQKIREPQNGAIPVDEGTTGVR